MEIAKSRRLSLAGAVAAVVAMIVLFTGGVAMAIVKESTTKVFGPLQGLTYANFSLLESTSTVLKAGTYTTLYPLAPMPYAGVAGSMARLYKGTSLCAATVTEFNEVGTAAIGSFTTSKCGNGTYHSKGRTTVITYNWTFNHIDSNATPTATHPYP